MNQYCTINREEYPHFLEELADWSMHFDYFSILNSNQYKDSYGKYEILAGFGAERILTTPSFESLASFHQEKKTWLFGHLSYDLKNEVEKLSSRHPSKFGFPDLCFFQPNILFLQEKGTTQVNIYVTGADFEQQVLEFKNKLKSRYKESNTQFPKLLARETKEEYIEAITKLKAEIQYGNIYEINYCQEFYAENIIARPSDYYIELNRKSAMPFSAFYRNKQDYLICASPERYLTKRGDQLYSQPIKGTARRGASEVEDAAIKKALKADLKEQTENVMIVDLVRNDLSRTAARGSVKVEELFGVYTFPQVHQLISTVKSSLSSNHSFADALKYSFPMGSMTGAPKISAMKLADLHEKTKREIYSGAVGYVSPDEDFDFNVVIRSLIYSTESKYLSLTVGGAITMMSEPKQEYEECLLKAKAIFDLQKE